MVNQWCTGCGAVVPSDRGAWVWSCPNRRKGDDVDHVLVPTASGGTSANVDPKVGLDPGSDNPFVRYRRWLTPYALWRDSGRDDRSYLELIDDLDQAVTRVAGIGFHRTPLAHFPTLDREVGARVWVKDETNSVAGSHKSRHLFGVAVHLRVLEELGRRSPTDLAIASCGNAARAAGVIAAAAGWTLRAYVPADADDADVAGLRTLGVDVRRCERDGTAGDPSYRRFRRAVAEGAVPFSCQGPDNGMVIEGASTLAWEVAEARAGRVDRVVVQVGGGALATAVTRGFERCGITPVFDTVQTAGAHPLERALARLLGEVSEGGSLDAVLRDAAQHRGRYMWPWEPTPRSEARGILDDETYDWLAIARATLRSGGTAVVADESTLLDANRLARAATGLEVDVTGSAGLAGLLLRVRSGSVPADGEVVVIFTG